LAHRAYLCVFPFSICCYSTVSSHSAVLQASATTPS
jgi:hypothetical protein